MQLTELVTLQAKGMYVNHTACTWEGLEHAPQEKLCAQGSFLKQFWPLHFFLTMNLELNAKRLLNALKIYTQSATTQCGRVVTPEILLTKNYGHFWPKNDRSNCVCYGPEAALKCATVLYKFQFPYKGHCSS